MRTLAEVMQARVGPPTETRTNGERHYPCPKCGGTDRFLVRPEGTRGYCRQCYWQPDAIQYLREIDGLSYAAAAQAVGKSLDPPPDPALSTHVRRLQHEFLRWREQMWCRAYQELRQARHQLCAAQAVQQAFLCDPRMLTATEKTLASLALIDAEITFWDAQEAFLLLSPKHGDTAQVQAIWAQTRRKGESHVE